MEDRLNSLSLNTTPNVSTGQSTLTVATSDNDINAYIDHPVSLESLYDQLNILRSGPTTNPDATIGRSTSHTGPIANSAMNTASSLTCIVQSLHRELDVLSLGPATDDGTNGQSTSHAAPANGGMLDIGSMGLHTSRNDITSASQARALRAERQAQLSKLRKQMDEVADRMENLSMVKAVPAAVPTLRDIEKVKRSETLSDEEKDAQIDVLRKAIQAVRRAYQLKENKELAAFVDRLGNRSGRSDAEVKRLYKEHGLRLKVKSGVNKKR